MRASFFIAFLLAFCATIAADEPRFPIKTFTWENDDIFLPGGVDRYYTNGLRLTFTRDPVSNPTWLTTFRTNFCEHFCNGSMRETMGVIVGHSFYTPQDITRFAPQPRDRPYAGWIYTGLSVQLTDENTDDPNTRAARTQHSFEGAVGLLGPGAGARFLQTEWHEMPFVNGRPPNGWSHQIRNEPTLQLNYLHSRRYGSRSLDVVPNAGAALGTVQTYATAGVLARAGRNITGFGTPILTNTIATVPPRPDVEYYVFAGADARYVFHNAFLDGGFFNDDNPSIPRRNTVVDVRAGASFRYRSLRLTYSLVERSRELQRASFVNEGRHRFASVTLSVERELRFQ